MGNNAIHLAFAFDASFFAPACVAIKSAVSGNHGRDGIVVHVLHDGIGDERIDAIRRMLSDFPNATVRSVVVSECDLPSMPMRNKPICYATLFLGRFIDAERVLCLDADILVQGDVRKLWDMPFDGNVALLAPANATKPPPEYDETIFFDGRPHVDAPYFNAGILVVDLRAWRSYADDFVAAVIGKSHLHYGCDQAPINYVLRGKIGRLPKTWNHCSQIRGAEHAQLIHYQGPHHPWRFTDDPVVFRLWRDFCRNEVAPFVDDPKIAEALGNHSARLPPLPEFWKAVPKFSFFPDAFWQVFGFVRASMRRLSGSRRRVLVYLSPFDALGDSILAIEPVRRLRARFAGCGFEAVVPQCAVGLFKSLRIFDAVWPHSALSSKDGVPRRMLAGRWDTVVSLRRNIDGRDLRWLRRFLPVRIAGYSGDQCCEFLYRCSVRSEYRSILWKDCNLPNDIGSSKIHQLDAHRMLLALLGVHVQTADLLPLIPGWFADDSAWESIYGHDGRVYVCAPCGTSPYRNYPAAGWIEVFSRLAPCTVVLAGGAKDAKATASMSVAAPAGVRLVDLAGKTTLPQLCGLMIHADAVLALDSGPMHLAIACGVPVVAVTGLGHFGRFAPYPVPLANVRFLSAPCRYSGCSWHCICNRNQCIAGVPPEEIAGAVAEVLSSSRQR